MSHLYQITNCLLCGSSKSQTVYTTKTHMMNDDGARFHFECCKECQLIYLNPQVLETHLADYYPSYYLPYRGAKAWGKFAKLVEMSQRRIDLKRVKIARKFLYNSDARVLDVGCGNPTFLHHLSKFGYNCTGLDFKSEGWEGYSNGNERLDLIQQDTIDHQSESAYDLITMWHYLEHDYHPYQTLKHLHNLSHANSRLVIEVPDYDSISRKFFGTYWEGFHAPRHTAIYTSATLKKMLNSSGWEVEESLKYGTLDSYSLWWMSKMERKEIDWSASMEPHFWGYVRGMISTTPLLLLKPWLKTGVQLVTARPQKS